MGGWKYLPKMEGFQPKWEGWNLWHFSEDDIGMLPKTKTVGDDLQSTALRLTNDDNDDYQWLPAEFRNRFSFGNVC